MLMGSIRIFREYLAQKAGIDEKYIPYYLRWVKKCYAFLGIETGEPLKSKQKESFLGHMSKEYEDWQVKQADTALRHYAYCISSMNMERASLSRNKGKAYKVLENRLKSALRIRQRAYSTEKS